MINATKEKLASFFQGTMQYEVPFFQRAYVWDDDNWATFWDHVIAVLERHQTKRAGEHFIGTIITKLRPAERLGQQVHDLIDGQQRLITVALLLRAIGDTVDGEMAGLRDVVADDLRFRDSRKQEHARVVPSRNDLSAFASVMAGNGNGASSNEHRIVQAYWFFRERLEGMTDEWRDQLRSVLLEKVSVISMMLSHEDDEQEIFDTINALGVRLTTAELLKNYVFKEASIQPQYADLWEAVFEDSEEHVEFWNTERTAGRVVRTNIEVLLYCFLVIKVGEVRLESLFKEYKKWLEGKSGEERRAFLRELKEYAEIYYAFPSGPDLNEIEFAESEKRFFHVVDNLMVTTILPLVLYVYRRVPATVEREAALSLLESYLVRRNVCRLMTKNYNQLFVQIIKKLEEHAAETRVVDAQVLRGMIKDFRDVTNRMPSDEEFRSAFQTSQLSNQNSREILFLLALRQIADGLSDVSKLSLGNYTVEHMMPVKWEANWHDRELNSEERAERGRALRTLGNLTLVTKRLNSKMQHAAWEDKKVHLRKYSSLPLTAAYLDLATWDEAAIASRAAELAEVAERIWGDGD